MTEATAPAWARGYALEELRAVAEVYRQADKPYVLGAFSAVKENTVAEWMDSAELVTYARGAGGLVPSFDGAVRVFVPRVRVPVRDFTGEVRARVEPGAAVLYRPAATTGGGWADLLELARGQVPLTEGRPVWLEGWLESPDVRLLAASAGLRLLAVKIKASSELVGVWSPPQVEPVSALGPADRVTLGRLGGPSSLPHLAQAAAAEVEGLDGWAQHYSSYNARRAWTALSLHGYTDPAVGPDFEQIMKPAEMSKAWKAEHPGWEAWPLEWTPLRAALPMTMMLAADLAAYLETDFQRVRLMRLEPGGGELTRHSDITDPEAGTAPGKLARLHVPLITNPQVLFRQWTLEARQVEANMAAGSLWYLDTRKPHRAGNYGTSPRVHLVVDAYMSEKLRAAIAGALEAEEAA